MLIGMVLAEDHETIVPIVEGLIARTYNMENNETVDIPNPALTVETGKRGTTVKWMVEQGVKILCSPPINLCELSYNRAREEELSFYRVPPNTTFKKLIQDLENGKLQPENILPMEEVEPSK
ncbi:hypothetical protein AB1K83_12220 [Sporosarcina sp. 179-K 3D1 HS]|uniref:hypothetical protein n=1 Tax=Sporosarcina sp. 179-K 3D1 HS TaxID=3232169 RepID=UPI0039A3834D